MRIFWYLNPTGCSTEDHEIAVVCWRANTECRTPRAEWDVLRKLGERKPGGMTENVICDDKCETRCALAEAGRRCPSLAEYRKEMRDRFSPVRAATQ